MRHPQLQTTAAFGAFLLPALGVAVPANADPGVVKILPSENALYCVRGQVIDITGHAHNDAGLDHSLLTENGTVLATRAADATGDDTYDFRWTATTPGTHYLLVKYVLPSGAEARARRVTITVLDAAPVSVAPALAETVNDAPLTAQAVPSQMVPARLDCFLDGALVGSGDPKSATFTLPLHKAAPGPHVAFVQAVDAQGERFVSSPQTITVPERLALSLPAKITLRAFGDPVPFNVTLAPGVKVARLTYSWQRGDGLTRHLARFSQANQTMQDIGTVAAPPFTDGANIDDFRDGDYQVQAAAVTDDGTVYTSQLVQVHFTNQAQDDKDALAAKQEADREAAEQAKRDALIQQEQADTLAAVKSGQVTFVVVENLKKVTEYGFVNYFIALKITNRTNRLIGPFLPSLNFDDFSSEPLTAYQGTVSTGEHDNFIDPAEQVIPGEQSRTFTYFASSTLNSEVLAHRKASTVEMFDGVSLHLAP